MAMAKEKKKFKWEPVQKIKHRDSIKSSDFTHAKPFIASYEKEERPQMNHLLSMEYAKIWHREKKELERSALQDTKVLPKNFLGLNKKKQDMRKGKETLNTKKAQPK